MNIPATNTSTKNAAEPTTVPSTSFADFILGQIRCAALRSKIVANQLEVAATALSAGLIAPETALLVLHETGLFDTGASS